MVNNIYFDDNGSRFFGNYGKCSKILNVICLSKTAYTNSADPDQTASEEAV